MRIHTQRTPFFVGKMLQIKMMLKIKRPLHRTSMRVAFAPANRLLPMDFLHTSQWRKLFPLALNYWRIISKCHFLNKWRLPWGGEVTAWRLGRTNRSGSCAWRAFSFRSAPAAARSVALFAFRWPGAWLTFFSSTLCTTSVKSRVTYVCFSDIFCLWLGKWNLFYRSLFPAFYSLLLINVRIITAERSLSYKSYFSRIKVRSLRFSFWRRLILLFSICRTIFLN